MGMYGYIWKFSNVSGSGSSDSSGSVGSGSEW